MTDAIHVTGEFFISQTLQRARERRQLATTDVALARGVDPTTISRLERLTDGRQYRNERIFEETAEALGVSPLELILEEVEAVRPERAKDIKAAREAAMQARMEGKVEIRLFSLAIRRARLSCDLPGAELARRCGWASQCTVAQAEDGAHKNEVLLERVAKGLNMLVPDLFIVAFVDWNEETAGEKIKAKGRAKLIEHNGEALPRTAWAARFGVSRQALDQAIAAAGGDVAKAFARYEKNLAAAASTTPEDAKTAG